MPAFISIVACFVMYGMIYSHTRSTFREPKQPFAMSSQPEDDVMMRSPSVIYGDSTRAQGIGARVTKTAKSLLLYPVIYSICLIPTAVVKLGAMAGWRTPYGLACFSGILLALTAVFDCVLFFYTRRSFISGGRRLSTALSQQQRSLDSKDKGQLANVSQQSDVDHDDTVVQFDQML